jgi:hypothetical protein
MHPCSTTPPPSGCVVSCPWPGLTWQHSNSHACSDDALNSGNDGGAEESDDSVGCGHEHGRGVN